MAVGGARGWLAIAVEFPPEAIAMCDVLLLQREEGLQQIPGPLQQIPGRGRVLAPLLDLTDDLFLPGDMALAAEDRLLGLEKMLLGHLSIHARSLACIRASGASDAL